MHAARLALPLALVTALLAACGGGGDEQGATTAAPGTTAAATTPEPATASTTSTEAGAPAEAGAYPADVRQNFLDACNRSSDGKRSACRCALRKLEETVSYEDFKQADAAIRGGGAAAPGTAKKIQDAISGCV